MSIKSRIARSLEYSENQRKIFEESRETFLKKFLL